MGRNSNRTWTVYYGKDEHWHGRVTVGTRDDGSPDRRHVMSRSKAKVMEGVKSLMGARDAGKVPKVGEKWTVEAWLVHWLETIARPSLKDSSYDAYRIAVHTHLVPALGKHRLDRLQPEHLER